MRKIIAPSSSDLEWTGERFVPSLSGEIALEHFHRYFSVLNACVDRDVLDIASGEGYGSHLISQVAKKVVSVDLDHTAIAHASTTYSNDRLVFIVGNCNCIPLLDKSIDVVVSFETLEHISDHELFVREIKRVLRDDGVLIISTPDKAIYSCGANSKNPYHVKELFKDEFEALLRAHFKNVTLCGQRTMFGSWLFPSSPERLRSHAVTSVEHISVQRTGEVSFSKTIPSPTYLIGVASDSVLPVVKSGIYEAADTTHLLSQFRDELGERGEQVAALQRTMAEREGRIEALSGDLAAARAGITERDDRIETMSGELSTAQAGMAEREGRIEALSGDLAAARAGITERDGEIASLNRAVAAERERLTQLEGAVAARDGELAAGKARIGELEGTLATRDGELAAGKARIGGLEGTLASRVKELNERVGEAKALRQRVTSLEARLAGVYASRSWRITGPLRAVSRCLRWLLRNTRRALMLAWWLSTGQFSRAAKASLPYYRRFVPLRVKEKIPSRVREAVKRRLEGDYKGDHKGDYYDWIARNDTLSDDDRSLIRSHITSFQDKPKFSILMPVYNTPGEYLRQAIDSVVGQLYQDWELCIVDDASASNDIRAILEEYAHKDARIRPFFRQTTGGISACTNTALEMASGDWIVLMDHDDVLAEHALYLVAEAINSNPDAAIVYSDEDHIDAAGRRSNPYFKPDWDYDLFLGQNLINHLGAYRADLARQVGEFREGFEGSQDWDFALRVLDSVPNARVHHIPFILYHWRETDDTFSQISPERALDAAQRAVNEHFKRTKQAAAAIPAGHSSYPSHLRIKRDLPAERPLVSIVIPTKDQCEMLRTCIDGLVNRTDYEPVEIVVVDNGSSETDALAFLANIRTRKNVKVVEDPRPFNFSRLVNLGVAASSGEVCVLLNNDVDVINSDWLDELVSHALRPEVGAVGAKLYFANDTLQHGGVILGILAGRVAGHAHRFFPRESPGYLNRLNLTHNLSCVTAACLAMRHQVYDAVGGFNEQDLTVAFNDVDFCIRVRQAGYKIIWTPNAELYHYESLSRGYETTPEKAARFSAEITYMRQQWGPVLDNDPSYNPNLSVDSPSFDLAATTRVRKPWFEFEFTPGCSLGQEAVAKLQDPRR